VPPTEATPIQKLPPSVDELIDELDRFVPETIPSVDASMLDVQRQAGKRELVIFLKHLRDKAKGSPRERKRSR
jgi:hypothetical protein